MRTAVRDTSLDAYHSMIEDGSLGRSARRVLRWIQLRGEGDHTLQEISLGTGMPINAVSGRVNDLKKAERLVESKKRACSVTGRTVTPVKLPEVMGQLELGLH